jgi:hypothetical protein
MVAYAVAGMVADRLDWEPGVSVWEIMDEWESSGDTEAGLSDTDMQFIPQDRHAREVAVNDALKILRDPYHKARFDNIVPQLLEYGRTDGPVIDVRALLASGRCCVKSANRAPA